MGVIKFVIWFPIFVFFLTKDKSFCKWRGLGITKPVIFCGRHKCMTRQWIRITTNSIIRDSCFFFKIKSDTFLIPSSPSPHNWQPNQRIRYFQLALNFWCEKNYGFINIIGNKVLWTRKYNRRSSGTSGIPVFTAFSNLNFALIRTVPSTWHIAALQLKDELTLMKNSGQVCFFSELITIYLLIGVGWISVGGTQLVFYWFNGRNFMGDDQNCKRSGDNKKDNQISKWKYFFLFYHSKLSSHFVPVYP